MFIIVLIPINLIRTDLDEAGYLPIMPGGLQKGMNSHNVILDVLTGINVRIIHTGLGRQVNDGINGVLLEDFQYQVKIAQITQN